MTQIPARRRAMIYIDGFNLYYGLLKNRADLKWLDLQKVARLLFPHYEISSVKYFSAEVDSSNLPRLIRQRTYWSALRGSGVTIIPGRLEYRDRHCGVSLCSFGGDRKHLTPVEKMTDVNLALHIVTDARVQKPDLMCVISGDTDLMPALDMVRRDHRCQRRVFIPCTQEMLKYRRVDQFGLLSWDTVRLTEAVVSNCRFDDVIAMDGHPHISCPSSWTKLAAF